MRIFAIILCAGLLGGCWVTSQPSFMPAGYTYHQNEHKSPPERTGHTHKKTTTHNAAVQNPVYLDTRPPADVYGDMDVYDMDVNSTITPMPMDRATLRSK